MQELVRLHYEALYRYAYRLSGSANEAADLTQEAFCQAQAKFGQLRDTTRAKAWLFSILRNTYLHRVRDARRDKLVPLDYVGDLPERPPEQLSEIDAQVLQEALNQLPEEFRSPLILYYFDDFSYRDIAEHMAVPIGTVMSRLARAKAYLRAKLLPVVADGLGRGSDGL